MLFLDRFRTGLNKFLEMPAYAASCVVAFPPIASHLDSVYESFQQNYQLNVPSLRAGDREIVEGMKHDGVFISSLSALGLPGSDELLDRAEQIANRRRPLERSFQSDGDEIMANPAILSWGLNDRLLDIAENYLGVPVGYDGINYFFTKADGSETGARRWHRDAEDRRMLKIAVYIHDVDFGGGPFQLLRRRLRDHDRMVRGKFPALTQQKLEEELDDFIADRDIVTCVGKRGTVVFADTASFYHRGAPATTQDRFAIYFNYMNRAPLRPFRCERSTLSRAQLREFASRMPRRQRDCVLWRDALPLLGRIVPPAPVWK